jgi:tyrosyl-tRNA synthetase
MPMLPGTDGVQKMSKSLGNYIGIDEPPREIFGKTMSLRDDLLPIFFEYLTDVPDSELDEIGYTLQSGSTNPMDIKKRLAYDLVTQFHSSDAAQDAQSFFERTVQSGETPEDIPTLAVPTSDMESRRLSDLIVEAGFAASSGEARRLINQGAVRLDDSQIGQNVPASSLASGVLRVGRRRFVRLLIESP